MENTFVPELLIGEEENGCYLALDLGGTNFRVMLLAFDKGRVDKEEVCTVCTVPAEQEER